jgi:ornithine cyclodeaminase/alanine dehydrogenase-like protein (mu-crystallin family)
MLRYLPAWEAEAHLPPASSWVELARSALTSLVDGTAEMPPKLSLHPRPGASLEAMPCWHRPAQIAGMKWIADVASNRDRGLPSVHGLIVLNDAETGVPEWIMDAGAITAARTAGVSGLAIDLLAAPEARTATILGAGVQACSHLRILAQLRPGARVTVFTPNTASAERFAGWASEQPGIAQVKVAGNARDAVAEAEIVISAAALDAGAQVMRADWVRRDSLVVAVDDDTYVSGPLASEAAAFVIDDRAQFDAFRARGAFTGYPDPTATLGQLASGTTVDLLRGSPVVATSLGCTVVDMVFADAVRVSADAAGTGTELAG